MKLDEMGARAGEALRGQLDAVEVPEPAAVIRHWRRARTRTAAVVVAIAVAVAAAVVGAVVASGGSSDGRISTVRPKPAPIGHVDAVPTFLWIDAADVTTSGVLYRELVERLARVGQSITGRTCNPVGFGDSDMSHVLFEDPAVLRRDGGLSGVSAQPTPAAYPPVEQPTCSLRVADSALRLATRVGQLLPAWFARVRALESTPSIAQALLGEIACMRVRGYTVSDDGYVDAASVLAPLIQNGAIDSASARATTTQFWAQAGRDYADCFPPLLAAREPVRGAARSAFVAEHRADVRRLQRSLEAYVRAVEEAKPLRMQPSVRERTAGFVADKARSMGEDHPTRAEAVLTTRREATALTGSAVDDDTLVYLVQIRGRFRCPGCSNPAGAPESSGTVATLALDVRNLGQLDLGLADHTVDLEWLGVVNRIP
jgi:hypothetical protein